jgi:hypothetical protein
VVLAPMLANQALPVRARQATRAVAATASGGTSCAGTGPA